MTVDRLIFGLLVAGFSFAAFLVAWRFTHDVPVFP